jgi:hypothetical protein
VERSSVVVKALCYKPEDRGFETMGWINFFNLHNPSDRTKLWLVLPQPLTEMSIRSRKMFLGSRCVGLTTLPSVNRLCKQCGNLSISQPDMPPGPVTGIALLHFHSFTTLNSTDTTCHFVANAISWVHYVPCLTRGSMSLAWASISSMANKDSRH